MNRLRTRPFLAGFVAVIVAALAVLTIAVIANDDSLDDAVAKNNPLAGPATVLPPAKIRMPLSRSVVDTTKEALYTTDGGDLHYVGPNGRFALHPIPLPDADREAAALGRPTAIRAVAAPPAPLGQQGRFPDGVLLADSAGTVFIVWEKERHPIQVLLTDRPGLETAPQASSPLFLVAAY